jgi:hypothetical protein
MIRLLVITILLSLSIRLFSQKPVGAWSDHLSYFSAKCLALSPEEIFASTGNSIIVFNRQYEELGKITRVQGLSETAISSIGWSDDQKALVIAYTSTNIDVVRNKTVYNIPDIKNKYITGKKEIFRIKARGKFAYMASSFGIVVVDITKNEINDTWKPGTGGLTAEVYDISFAQNRVYAATSTGVYYADPSSSGLSYYGNWTLINTLPTPSGIYNAVYATPTKVYVNRSEKSAPGDTVYVTGSGTSLFSFSPGELNLSLDGFAGGFTISSRWVVRVFRDDGTLTRSITSYNPGGLDVVQAIAENGNIWLADNSAGLVRGTGMTSFSKLNLPGPYTNNVASLVNSGGKTYITGGAVDNAWNNIWRPLQIFAHENNAWYSEISYDLKDPMRVLPDPDNKNHYWVSTWGSGLLEYNDNTLVKNYNDSNSPLETIIPGKPYSRICGLAMDKNRNIWITQSGVPGTIKVLKPDGTWIVNPVTVEAPTIGDMIITKAGHKWVVLPRGYGLFVLDDNKTPDNFSDDRYKQFLIKDTDNKVISVVYCIAEDLDGNIWVGTDQGPAVYYNPLQIFESDPRAFRVKVPRNDGTGLADYMLGTEIITSVSVDGANRKWLGTFSSGAYLLSADGTTKLLNYTEENSPLLSNTVVSIDADDKTGEVWFGTAMGVISVRGDATAGGTEFNNVYTFPNPVRETYQGNVTITGLLRNTRIKITDVSGNLVYETVSDGGQASWNLETYNGERVSTGVYLVFCSSEDGLEACVTKMLVIK